MGGKSTDTTTSNTGYTGGLTPYANNLFGGNSAPATDNSPSGMQKLGQQIMQASNNFSAQQGGPEEQAIAGIGNALVNKFAPSQSPANPAPNLFGGSTPTFTPPNQFTTNTLSPSGGSGMVPIQFQQFQPGLSFSPANPAGTTLTGTSKPPTLFG